MATILRDARNERFVLEDVDIIASPELRRDKSLDDLFLPMHFDSIGAYVMLVGIMSERKFSYDGALELAQLYGRTREGKNFCGIDVERTQVMTLDQLTATLAEANGNIKKPFYLAAMEHVHAKVAQARGVLDPGPARIMLNSQLEIKEDQDGVIRGDLYLYAHVPACGFVRQSLGITDPMTHGRIAENVVISRNNKFVYGVKQGSPEISFETGDINYKKLKRYALEFVNHSAASAQGPQAKRSVVAENLAYEDMGHFMLVPLVIYGEKSGSSENPVVRRLREALELNNEYYVKSDSFSVQGFFEAFKGDSVVLSSPSFYGEEASAIGEFGMSAFKISANDILGVSRITYTDGAWSESMCSTPVFIRA